MTAPQAPDRWFALVLLGLAYSINSADRLLLSLFIEPIKAEYQLSDAGVSFITAFVFGAIYVGASVPLAVLGDRRNRRNMLAIWTALFSISTALTGWARSYWLLLVSRVGVAVGEAGYTPVAVALLSDKFAPHLRYVAMSLFGLGVTVGSWAGSTVAGHLEERLGWRGAMIAFGLAGVPLALAIRLMLREPVRAPEAGAPADRPRASFLGAIRICIARRSVFHTIVGAIVTSMWAWGMFWWVPAFFNRSFGTSVSEAATLLGAMHGIVGTVSILLATLVLAPISRRDARWPMWFLAGWCVLATVPAVAAILAPTLRASLWGFYLFMPISYASTGPILAAVASGVPAGMRSQASAVVLACANLAALVLAPQFVGFASDALAPHLAQPSESLRYALLPLAFLGLWGGVHFWLASRHIRADQARSEAPEPPDRSPAPDGAPLSMEAVAK